MIEDMPMQSFLKEVGLSTDYRRLLSNHVGCAEKSQRGYANAHQNIREEIVKCLWFGGHYATDGLKLDDGRRVEVLSPGWWNVESGPDFLKAELLIEDVGYLKGDVEVHTTTSAWWQHGHQWQKDYNGVILHVTLWSDGKKRPVQLQNGDTIPQLTLSKFVDEEIDELVEVVDMEGEAEIPNGTDSFDRYCKTAIKNGDLPLDRLGDLLDIAGDHRLHVKIDKMDSLLENNTPDQVLYQNLAEALGYKNNRMPFLQLAHCLPIKKLRELCPLDAGYEDKRHVIEAVFYGAGGFLETDANSNYDDQTREYRRSLLETWRSMPDSVRAHQMGKNHWNFADMRPSNHPLRRIAALASLYAQHINMGLFGRILKAIENAVPAKRRRLDTTLRDAVTDFFTSLSHPYWSRRYTFGTGERPEEIRLVGRGRAVDILINVIIPLYAAYACRERNKALAGRVVNIWMGLPRNGHNAVTGRMCRTMFGQNMGVINSTRREQGLHQLYNDFCNAETGCEACIITSLF
jgi:hypothetical protein